MDKKLKVGQVVYLEIKDYIKKILIKEFTVSYVGRKYFLLDGHNGKFDINTLRGVSDYTINQIQVYLSTQEIYDKNEINHLSHYIYIYFYNRNSNNFKLSLNKLRAIKTIIDG